MRHNNNQQENNSESQLSELIEYGLFYVFNADKTYSTPNLIPFSKRDKNYIKNPYTWLEPKKTEIAETNHGLKTVFENNSIPEINKLILGKVENNKVKTVLFRFGDCAKQRKLYAYVSRQTKDAPPKIKYRRIKQRDTQPLNLNTLRLNKKYEYRLSFKCIFCGKHNTMNIKRHNKQRKTPKCNHPTNNPLTRIPKNQDKILTKVSKIKTTNKNPKALPKIIYEVD